MGLLTHPKGTVQNFLLGGGWYVSGKVPVKMHATPWNLLKILVSPLLGVAAKNGYPPP